jgi:hypothetical protein
MKSSVKLCPIKIFIVLHKGNNKIPELRTILQRESQDDQQLVNFINIFQPGSRLVRQFIFNLQLL